MTNQEVIEKLKYINFCGSCTHGKCDECDNKKAKDMAIEVLEKQVPKNPIAKHYEDKGEKPYIKYGCPNDCGIQLSPVTNKHLAHEHIYCPKCGQKIDWSEVNERN